MYNSIELLTKRYEGMIESDTRYLEYVFRNKIWNDISTINDMVLQGTLSIGFIGLSETVEVLTGKKPFQDIESFNLAIKIISYMRNFVDRMRVGTNLNISLLASPGELIANRFCEIDKEIFNHKIQDKGFYTNSFHVEVNSGISIFNKIDLEAPFHSLCNGGCITYIELSSAPLNNILALKDGIEYGEKKGISYLGFNYPLDICNNCSTYGTFDICDKCESKDIKRIRRVSGYLEDICFFTSGKFAEVNEREPNI